MNCLLSLLPWFITAMTHGKMVSVRCKRKVLSFTKAYLNKDSWKNGSLKKVVYWSWTIWWPREGTIKKCLIFLPNIFIIATSLSSICVKTCFHRANVLKVFQGMLITWSLSRTLEINWVWRIYCCKHLLRGGKILWKCAVKLLNDPTDIWP